MFTHEDCGLNALQHFSRGQETDLSIMMSDTPTESGLTVKARAALPLTVSSHSVQPFLLQSCDGFMYIQLLLVTSLILGVSGRIYWSVEQQQPESWEQIQSHV